MYGPNPLTAMTDYRTKIISLIAVIVVFAAALAYSKFAVPEAKNQSR